MKIIINNLGPISSFEFELSKNLNVIFGKNNIGKSYAITAVYLIIKNLIDESFLNQSYQIYFFTLKGTPYGRQKSLDSIFVKEIKKAEEYLIETFKESNETEIDATKIIEKLLSIIITETFLHRLEKSFSNSFASLDDLKNKLTDDPFSIELNFDYLNFRIILNKDGHFEINYIKLNYQVFAKKALTNRHFKRHYPLITIYYNTKKTTSKDKEQIGIFDEVLRSIIFGFVSEVYSYIRNVYYLPASRSGLYQALSTFSAVIAELSKSRNFLSNKIELPNISEPVSDYFLCLSNISTTKKSKMYSAIAEDIENIILGGEVIFNADSKKIVFFHKIIDTELDLSVTSSMISEIAPIVAYLKYIISEESEKRSYSSSFFNRREENKQLETLLFIEEPEAHLHPVIQIQLMELFANLSKCNVKVAMTTHSNYMFNKLSNLILQGKIKPETINSYLMKMTDKGSIVDENAMKAEEEGIVDENFADVAEKLYNERLKAYNELNIKNAN